jgi:hypothetical protein
MFVYYLATHSDQPKNAQLHMSINPERAPSLNKAEELNRRALPPSQEFQISAEKLLIIIVQSLSGPVFNQFAKTET